MRSPRSPPRWREPAGDRRELRSTFRLSSGTPGDRSDPVEKSTAVDPARTPVPRPGDQHRPAPSHLRPRFHRRRRPDRPTGTTVDQLTWQAHVATASRCPDGTGAFTIGTLATPGAPNQCTP